MNLRPTRSIPSPPFPPQSECLPRNVQNLHRRVDVHLDRSFLDGRCSTSPRIRRAPVSRPPRNGEKQGCKDGLAASSRNVERANAFSECRGVNDGEEGDLLAEELLDEYVELQEICSARSSVQLVRDREADLHTRRKDAQDLVERLRRAERKDWRLAGARPAARATGARSSLHHEC